MPLITVGNDVEEHDLSKIAARAKCATVTMMLAERIVRRDWSVDNEPLVGTNAMNVWQTLEFLSGAYLRKNYHYDGYNDTENAVRTLTPSWRRDSFVEKKEESAILTPRPEVRKDGNVGNNGNELPGVVLATGKIRNGSAGIGNRRLDSSPLLVETKKSSKNNKNGQVYNKYVTKKKPVEVDIDPVFKMSPLQYTDIIKCNFNLPRISARLERLMGTNVVRLTDRKYMTELRERIQEDYSHQLQKRINARELREVERERLLIIEGKSDVIPEELMDDPIFVVNNKANKIIQKQRSKLKTNRERNSERLKVQGLKWERERLQHEEEENRRLEEVKARRKTQRDLEERYKAEDAERGMDLLRIHNEDWRECEQKLKEFLERERCRMKERSWRVPTPFTSDPLDVQNIVRARQKFRDTEKRIRKQLAENSFKDTFRKKSIVDDQFVKERYFSDRDSVHHLHSSLYTTEIGEGVKQNMDDDSIDSSVEYNNELSSTISVSKQRNRELLENELENDVAKGILISKEQYEHLRYEDEKIALLRNAKNIREMYEIAELIILGEKALEEEEEGEEEIEDEFEYE